jgi:hypothetical protein
LTEANLKSLLSALPVRVLKDIKQLSKETGESVEAIVEKGVELYRKRTTSNVTPGNDTLANLLNDPKTRDIYNQVSVALGHRANAKFTDEERSARGAAGAAARAKSLTDERRKEIATKASLAAKKKRDEKRKMAKAAGSSKP